MSYVEQIQTHEPPTDTPPGYLREATAPTPESALAPWRSFLLKMESCDVIPARAQAAINHAEFLEWQSIGSSSASPPRTVEETMPSMLRNAVIYLSHQHLLNHHYPLRNNKRSTASSKSKIKEIIIQRDKLHESIAVYDKLMSGEDEEVAYEGLVGVFCDAQCIIKGTDTLSDEEIIDSKKALAGFLAELQVVKALQQNGMPTARRGTPAEDMRKADVVVPGPGMGSKDLHIQVKAGSTDPSGLSVANRHPGLEVRVPINTRRNGPLRMRPRYSIPLNLAVKSFFQPNQ